MYKNRAFTLIEALVVIGILTLMFALSIPAYRSYSRRNQLRQAAESVRSALVEAQNMALAPKEKEGDWYYVVRLNSNPRYGSERDCQVGKIQAGVSDFQMMRNNQLPSSVKYISPNNSVWYIGFKPPQSEAYFLRRTGSTFMASKLTSDPTITLCLIANCEKEKINVTLNHTTGQITINK